MASHQQHNVSSGGNAGREADSHGTSFEKKFLDMQQKYLQSMKKHNEEAEKWRMEKVDLRKKAMGKGGNDPAKASPGSARRVGTDRTNRPLSAAGARRTSTTTTGGAGRENRPPSASGAEDRATSPMLSTWTSLRDMATSPDASFIRKSAGAGPSPSASVRRASSSGQLRSPSKAAANATSSASERQAQQQQPGSQPAPLDYVALEQSLLQYQAAHGGGQPVPGANGTAAGGSAHQSTGHPGVAPSGLTMGGISLQDAQMVWGVDTQKAEVAQTNALLNLNQQLRTQLEDSDNTIKQLRHEVNHQKSQVDVLKKSCDEQARDHHAIVRERDLAVQKADLTNATITAMKHEKSIKDEDDDRMKHQHTAQLRELRAKLELSFEKCEMINKELNSRTNEVKEHTLTIASLQGRLALTESGLRSQKEANQSMLLEMQNLNTQLSHERRRLLGASREVQMAQLSKDQATDAAKDIEVLKSEKAATERENLKLLEDVAKAHHIAGERARSQVSTQLEELRTSAAHWERVSQLQYKDIAERNDQHQQCRAECDQAKISRDEADLIVRTLKVELQMAEAKLELVWPSHRRDARGLDPENLKDAFGRMKAQRAAIGGSVSSLPAHFTARYKPGGDGSTPAQSEEELRDQVAELLELNSLLVAENESLRLANEVLAERVKEGHEAKTKELEAMEKKQNKITADAKRSLSKVDAQVDRIKFLETQVSALRGVPVKPSMSLRDCGPHETVVELFLGQIVLEERHQLLLNSSTASSSASPEGAVGPAMMLPTHFCSLDFLLHEPVTTGTFVGGGTGTYLDASFAFKIQMDALLEYYIKSRGIEIQLHELETRPETMGGARYVTIGEGSSMVGDLLNAVNLDSDRPQVRGHLSIYALEESQQPNESGLGRAIATRKRIGAVEFAVTVRTPFSDTFKQLVKKRTDLPRHRVSSGQKKQHAGALLPEEEATGHDISIVSTSSSSHSASSALSRTQLENRVSPSFLEALRGVKEVRIEVSKFYAVYTLAKLPILSIFAQLEKAAEWWVQPPTNATPKYEFPYNAVHSIPVTNELELFDLLRSSLALALWDIEDDSAENYWGLGVQPLQCVLDQELLVVKVACDVTSRFGDLLGAVHLVITLSKTASGEPGDDTLDMSLSAFGGAGKKGELKRKSQDESAASIASSSRAPSAPSKSVSTKKSPIQPPPAIITVPERQQQQQQNSTTASGAMNQSLGDDVEIESVTELKSISEVAATAPAPPPKKGGFTTTSAGATTTTAGGPAQPSSKGPSSVVSAASDFSGMMPRVQPPITSNSSKQVVVGGSNPSTPTTPQYGIRGSGLQKGSGRPTFTPPPKTPPSSGILPGGVTTKTPPQPPSPLARKSPAPAAPSKQKSSPQPPPSVVSAGHQPPSSSLDQQMMAQAFGEK